MGDGANDALMLGQAGLGLSYNAKSDLNRVRQQAAIGRSRLMNVLYLLGITEEDISEANQTPTVLIEVIFGVAEYDQPTVFEAGIHTP